MEFLRVSMMGTWMTQLTLDEAVTSSATPAPAAALSDGAQSEEEPAYDAPDPDVMTTPRVWLARSLEAASIAENELAAGIVANEVTEGTAAIEVTEGTDAIEVTEGTDAIEVAEGTDAIEAAEGSAQTEADAAMLEELEQILQGSGDEASSTSSSASTSSSSSSSLSEVAMDVDAGAASGDEESREVHEQECLGRGRMGYVCVQRSSVFSYGYPSLSFPPSLPLSLSPAVSISLSQCIHF
jgi:hypothetical protein